MDEVGANVVLGMELDLDGVGANVVLETGTKDRGTERDDCTHDNVALETEVEAKGTKMNVTVNVSYCGGLTYFHCDQW